MLFELPTASTKPAAKTSSCGIGPISTSSQPGGDETRGTKRYVYAAVAALAATAMRVFLDRFIGYHHPYVTFYIAVLWSGWYGGLGPALLATLLGTAGAGLVVLPSLGFLRAGGNLTGLEFYLLVSITGAILFGARRKAQGAVARSAFEARRRLEELEYETAKRARAEDATWEAQRLLRTTYEHAPVGICEIDLSGSFLEVNPRFCAITGYSRDELRHRTLDEVLYAGAGETYHAEYERLRKGRISFCRHEMKCTRRDGSAIWAELTVALVAGSRGQPQQAIAVLQDVTDRRLAEERLREAQKSESIGLLAGGIAHDFNNLLTGMLGNAFLALANIPHESENGRLLQGVVEAAERAARLTGQLLAYAGGGRSWVTSFDVGELVQETVDLLRSSLPESIKLRVAVKTGLPPLRTDRAQIQQALTNLAVNGAEAIGAERPGVIAVKADLAEFDEANAAPNVGAIAAGKYLRVQVEDTGSGIDPGIVPRIFDPFFTTKFMGRGLGLAAVSGIVRAHKGAVLVSSEPGQGSAFTVLLPLNQASGLPENF